MGSNAFSVTNCTYDGTSGDPNPLCCIPGTVNGFRVFPLVFFRYLDAANTAGQMQQALTVAMWNFYCGVYGRQFSPWPTPFSFPTFPSSDAVAEHVQGPFPQPEIVYQPALIGSWTQ
jgi:hypothetical protein